MSKLVKGWRNEDIHTQARHYVRTYILLPSGFMGLICMLGGIGTLAYQFIASSTYTWTTFVTSSVLLLVGGLCGWIQTRYHRYLFATVPAVFAARMRSAVQRTQKKREATIPVIEHPGRQLVPLAYIIGSGVLLGGSAGAVLYGSMDAVPAILMPWAGFYWSKLFFWRGIVN
jgi:hypothetical protein